MRRKVTTIGVLAATAALSAACTSGASGTHSSRTTDPEHRAGGAAAAVPVASPGSTPTVCAAVRTAITADMTPFGSALGAVVGSSVGDDSQRRAAAVQDVATTMHKLGADITAATAPATDSGLRMAAQQTVQRINALAADPTFLGGVDSIDDVTTVTAKLTLATAPVANACRGS